jgi:hypothetical protein
LLVLQPARMVPVLRGGNQSQESQIKFKVPMANSAGAQILDRTFIKLF